MTPTETLPHKSDRQAPGSLQQASHRGADRALDVGIATQL